MEQQVLFPSQYEDEYLLRTLGPLAYRADIALSELVANAWDAGAYPYSGEDRRRSHHRG